MGQKQSSVPNKRRGIVKTKMEATEIVDLESSESTSSHNDQTKITSNLGTESISGSGCSELVSISRLVEELEANINSMTESEIDLYFATIKDSLHNYWRKVYDIKNTDDDVKNKKAELIDRIKNVLKNLNDRYLKLRMC